MKKKEINKFGVSGLIIAFLLIESNFHVSSPQWWFTAFLVLLIIIPEWDNNVNEFTFPKDRYLENPELLRNIGRFATQFYSFILTLNRYYGGIFFPRFQMSFLESFGNFILLVMIFYIMPAILVIFIKKMLWNYLD
jgi:hypothetical protein